MDRLDPMHAAERSGHLLHAVDGPVEDDDFELALEAVQNGLVILHGRIDKHDLFRCRPGLRGQDRLHQIGMAAVALGFRQAVGLDVAVGEMLKCCKGRRIECDALFELHEHLPVLVEMGTALRALRLRQFCVARIFRLRHVSTRRCDGGRGQSPTQLCLSAPTCLRICKGVDFSLYQLP